MPLLDSSVEWRWMREQIIELDHMLIETSQTEIPREESMGENPHKYKTFKNHWEISSSL